MYVPGILVLVLTFPGVIFHELGHQLFCKFTGVRVVKVRYFRLGNPAGYVVHETPTTFKQSFLIAMGPLISSSLVAVYFYTLGFSGWSTSNFVFIWLGFSVAMHSFPSTQDATNLWKENNRHLRKKNFMALVGYPFALVIFVANLLRIVWFDLLYAVFLMMLVLDSTSVLKLLRTILSL
jgi:hypothetical protein